jgi:hypothetical protein
VTISVPNVTEVVLKKKASRVIVNLKKNLTALLKKNVSFENKNEDRT